MTTLSFERAGVARLHLGLSRRLDDLLAEPGAVEALRDPVDSGIASHGCTATSPACAG